jgi:hypothetical protein
MKRTAPSLLGVVLLAAAAGACGRRAPEAPAGPTPEPQPTLEERYAAMPDTAVCVVDRTTQRGLRKLEAKKSPDQGIVLLVAGEIRPLDELHPVGVMAGYAGRESWLSAGEPIALQGRRYEKVGGERQVQPEQLQQLEEYRAIPVFADPSDVPPPRAIYVPVRPGCVFQAYVRADLLR